MAEVKALIRVQLCCGCEAARQKLEEELARCGFECVREGGDVILAVAAAMRGGWQSRLAELTRRTDAGVVALVQSCDRQAAERGLEGSGVAVLPGDAPAEILAEVLRTAAKTGERLCAVRDELCRTREKLRGEKIVARAKLLLVERRGMTESEAHRRIEKAAMDGRTTRCEIALAILKEYGF